MNITKINIEKMIIGIGNLKVGGVYKHYFPFEDEILEGYTFVDKYGTRQEPNTMVYHGYFMINLDFTELAHINEFHKATWEEKVKFVKVSDDFDIKFYNKY